MAQRTRVRPGRAVWVGALAVLCGGLAGCLDADKDRRPTGPPPVAKGAGSTVPGVGPNGAASRGNPQGTATGMNSNPYAPNTGGGITQANGQFQPDYRGQTGPYYDPNARANPNSAGMTPAGVPARSTSPNAYANPVVPSVGPGGSPPQPPGPGGLSPSYPSSPGGPPTSGMTTTQYRDPTPPSLSQLDPLPPSPPVNSTTPPVGPVSPASAPVPPAAAPMFPTAPATYDRR